MECALAHFSSDPLDSFSKLLILIPPESFCVRRYGFFYLKKKRKEKGMAVGGRGGGQEKKETVCECEIDVGLY